MPYVVVDHSGNEFCLDNGKIKIFPSQDEAVNYARQFACDYPPHPFDIAQVILRVQCVVAEPTVKQVT